jgi:hypothetical protein
MTYITGKGTTPDRMSTPQDLEACGQSGLLRPARSEVGHRRDHGFEWLPVRIPGRGAQRDPHAN